MGIVEITRRGQRHLEAHGQRPSDTDQMVRSTFGGALFGVVVSYANGNPWSARLVLGCTFFGWLIGYAFYRLKRFKRRVDNYVEPLKRD